MKPLTLYHYSKCSKSRAVHEILKDKKVKFEVREYLNDPLSGKELDALLILLKLEPDQLVRKSEDEYEELKLDKNPPKSRAAWLKILAKNPILIERPIVSNGKSAVVGRPPEVVIGWLK